MTSQSETLWGIGCYVDESGRRVPWRISHEEIGRDIDAATRVLTELGFAGKRVLWCSMLSQAGQFWPYVCGSYLAGARVSCADATSGEAARVGMFLRLMEYDAVFGITDAILDGFDETGRRYAEVFEGVRVVGALPGAYERLTDAGVAPTRFALCGPAVAMGCVPDGPALVSSDEWELAVDDGHICVSARRARGQEFVRTSTGVRGEIVDGGVTW